MRPAVENASPVVWLLLGYKAGDNAQVRALASALGWPFVAKHLKYRRTELLTNLSLRVTLAGIDRSASDPLEPPWPDLIICSGRRNEPVARWIHRASSARAKIIHIGRPWAPHDIFDLVITTPQYDVPDAPNILKNELPLHSITPEILAPAATRWASHLAELPRPRIVVLIGGNSGTFLMTRDRVRRLRLAGVDMARRLGGSLLLTDSARTPASVRDDIFAQIDVPHYCYRWGSSQSDNPYLGYLALGDHFIVTGDSVSMVAEAIATGKPVHIYHPQRHPVDLAGPAIGRPDWLRPGYYGWRAVTHRLAMRFGPARMKRDVPALLQQLVDSGRAAWLGAANPPKKAQVDADLQRTVGRVRALWPEAD